MTILIDIVVAFVHTFLSVLGGLGSILWQLAFPKQQQGYSATLTPERDILKTTNKGFSIGGRRAISIQKSFQHVICCAGSGYGKTSSVGLPSLFNLAGEGSVIALDPAKELYQHSAGYYRSKGYVIKTINFSDKDGTRSDGWNPFPKNPADLPNVITTLSQLELGTQSKDPFWQLQAVSLLTLLGNTLYQQDPSLQTFTNLHHLVNILAGRPKEIDQYMSKHTNEAGWTEYLAFNRNADNVKASIIASAKSVLHLWTRTNIQRITSHETIDLASIRKRKTIVYIQTNAAELLQYKSLIALYFDQLLSHVLSDMPKATDENLFLLLDEAGIYKINSLPLAITQARKMRVGICLLQQSDQQLYSLYGKEEGATILSNAYTKIYLTNQPVSTARELQELIGKVQYQDDKDITRIKPLLTIDDIRSMEPDKALVLHGHHRPSLVNLLPYYQHSKYKNYSNLTPPPILVKSSPDTPIPLLRLTPTST